MENVWLRWMRRMVATLGLIGGAVFAVGHFWSWVDPGAIERQARQVILAEVRERVGGVIDNLDTEGLAVLAARVSAAERARTAQLHRALADLAEGRIVYWCDRMLQIPPAQRAQFAESQARFRARDLIASENRLATIDALVKSKFVGVAAALMREFRIFTGTQAVVFFLLAATALARPKHFVRLVPIALAIVAAALYVGWAYVAEQDWLHAILFSDYVGFSFLGYVGLTAFALWDIAFNQARLSRHAPLAVALLFVIVGIGAF